MPAALLVRAGASAVCEVPSLNGHRVNDGFALAREVRLGVAVSVRQGGLPAPVIHEADTLSPDALMERLGDLVERARRGRLGGSETAGAWGGWMTPYTLSTPCSPRLLTVRVSAYGRW